MPERYRPPCPVSSEVLLTRPLVELRSFIEPTQVRYVNQKEQIDLIFAQVVGNAITHSALQGVQEEGLAKHMLSLGRQMAEIVKVDLDRAATKLSKAKLRYRFVE